MCPRLRPLLFAAAPASVRSSVSSSSATPAADRCSSAAPTVWLDEADELARAGRLQATVMPAISSVARKRAGVHDRVVEIKPGRSYLLLPSGALRVAHLTDHVPLRDVSKLIVRSSLAASRAFPELHRHLQPDD